jgi:hypothetical protein|tara:strand:- start:1874 stop:2644 length:771 start_codon:yes stop_codon:yes gene_type:complete
VFGRSHFLDEDVEAFHVLCWAWLLKCTGGREALRETPLVLPTPDFFPPTDSSGHERAEFIFEHVRDLAGMSEWPVQLVPQAELAGRVSTLGRVQHSGTAAGTFSHTGNSGQITYDPSHVHTPVKLIATFAHELSHYLNEGFQEAPPGGWELIEPATDVTSVFLGFGVFGANSAFEFIQTQDFESQGWSSEKFGYLSLDEWAFNLAIFCDLTGRDVTDLKPHLKWNLFKTSKAAAKYVERREIGRQILEDIKGRAAD